jgi:5-formyltetrahydrofolate cyclo-ligase
MSMPQGEIQTLSILKHALAQGTLLPFEQHLLKFIPSYHHEQKGKRCYIPRCHKSEMEMVRIHSMQDYENLPVNAWGFREPQWSNRSLELGIYFL